MSHWKSSYKLLYRNHLIEIKQDFENDFYIVDGMPTETGYIVTKNNVNVMPGAVWFQTVKHAKRAIDILISTEGDADMFHSGLEAYYAR